MRFIKQRKKITFGESQIQCALIQWARWNIGKFPELALLYAIPNGVRCGGFRAMKLKQEGLLAGMPDLCLPVSRHKKNSLYLETKTLTGTLSKVQKQIITKLIAENNEVFIYRSLDEGIQILRNYLE